MLKRFGKCLDEEFDSANADRQVSASGAEVPGEKIPEKTPEKFFNKKQLKILLLCGGIFALVLLIAYIAASVPAKAWDKTWLILVCGILAWGTGFSVFCCALLARRKNYKLMRPLIYISVVGGMLITYLCYSVLTPKSWNISWLLLLFIPILATGIDLIVDIALDSERTFRSLLAFIIAAPSAVYVILGVTKFAPWHPWWVIPVSAALADITLIIVGAKLKAGKKIK